MNILFTCVGRRVSLVDAFRRAMEALNMSGRLVATDITWASPAFHTADVGVLVPQVEDEQYIPALLEIVKKQRIGLLVPLTDLDLYALAREQEQFTGLGCTVMIASDEATSVCRDKVRTNWLLAETGLASVETFTLDAFRARPFFPCFAKPVRGSAGVGSSVIRDEVELSAHVGTYGQEIIIQEYLYGREFTIDVYRDRGGEVRCVVPRQRLFVRSGEVEKGITIRSEKLTSLTRRLAEAVDGLWGVFCCQCRWAEGSEPRFFEINPRFGGGAPLSIAAGADLPRYLLEEVNGWEISGRVGEFTENLLMLRYDEQVFVRVEDAAELPGYDEPCFR
jgi:carbamoyl-phosphate synthase large subunit